MWLVVWCVRDCAAAVGALRAGIRRDVQGNLGDFVVIAGHRDAPAPTPRLADDTVLGPTGAPFPRPPAPGAAAPGPQAALAPAVAADQEGSGG